ncbi:PQQ-binding-like beta-propeller repeat protein [Spirochaeta cellobiosiphila]|uniref:PQQ-binding-like beta-propeller repeat protein n=1 Tax=Spirochaeta cellobiosiphila TaxID=504483 RepID=UPI000427F4F2|nr:PQQ-binding-like beta-propeller repeat protein [Spirochaeta cellobiosiphila]
MISVYKIKLHFLGCIIILLLAHPLYGDDTFREIKLEDNSIIRWMTNPNRDHNKISVQRINNNEILWQNVLLDSTPYLDNVAVPISAYEAKNGIVCFPITNPVDSHGELARQQVALNIEDGVLLWETSLPVGVTQDYFYSISDTSHIYIHNKQAYDETVPSLYCLDRKDGRILWSEYSPPQVALVLQNDEYLLLHNGQLQSFYVYSKSDGAMWQENCSSPVFIHDDHLIWLYFNNDHIEINQSSWAGEKKILFQLSNTVSYHLSPYIKSSTFFFTEEYYQSLLYPTLLTKDSIVIPMVNERDKNCLNAYSLEGELLWTYTLGEKESFNWSRIYNRPFLPFPYNIPNSLIKAYPYASTFYQSISRYHPLLLGDRLIMLDLGSGKALWSQESKRSSDYYVDTISMKDNYYILIERGLLNEKQPNYLLKVESGIVKEFYEYGDLNSTDIGRGRTPIHYLVEGHDEFINWSTIDQAIATMLISNYGFPIQAFRAETMD